MGRFKDSQAGFTAVEGLLIVLVVAVIGFGGYYVWNTQKTNSAAVSTANSSQAAAKSKSTNQQPASTGATSVQKYLTIAEWGVKIPLNSNISTAYYSYDSGLDLVRVSLEKYKGTNCSTDLGQLYGIARSTEAGSGGVKVGGYYYSAVHPQAGCDGTSSNGTYDPGSPGSTEAMSYVPYLKTAISQIVAQ